MSLIQNVRVRGFDELKIRSVLSYMTDLKVENNEEIGHYGQTLTNPLNFSNRIHLYNSLGFLVDNLYFHQNAL